MHYHYSYKFLSILHKYIGESAQWKVKWKFPFVWVGKGEFLMTSIDINVKQFI